MARSARWSRTGLAIGTVIIVFGLAVGTVGCDRNGESQQPEAEVEGQNGGEAADQTASPYPELEDVERIEPTDAGPEAPAVYFLAGLKGYTEPCGCTADVMLGGIERITAFVRDARRLHPDAAMVDAGDWLFEYDEIPEHLEPQEKAKAEVIAEAQRRMGTRFSVPGNRDLALGVDFYESMMDRAGIEALGANLEFAEMSTVPSRTLEVDDTEVLFVGAGDPELYEEIEGVEATDDREAIREAVADHEADTVVLLYQGGPIRAQGLAEAIEDLDFGVVGHNPRLREDADRFGTTRLLEPYDQGRYVGRLKLYASGREGDFEDGRAGVRDEREALDRQIQSVRTDLRRLEVRTRGQTPPMERRLRERLEELEERRRQLLQDGIEIPEDRRAFLYEPIAMEPGYRIDETIDELRREYNRSLEELTAHIDRDPIDVDEGEPFYVGQAECAGCHGDAHDFWQETSHASAVETLQRRDKQFDQNCIGCHVDGWEEPGGSVLGNIEYEAEINGRTFTKDLHEVGCESCHGPGSNHLVDPVDEAGRPQHIEARPREQTCTECHVPDHSPTFDFDVYVDQITGPGHEYSGTD